MQLLQSRRKDPDSTLDFSIDWSRWLTPGDTIASTTWIVPSGLTNAGQNNSPTVATVFVSGGALGAVYTITCRVNTQAGKIDDFSFQIQIEQK